MKANARRPFEAMPSPAKPSSIIIQVETSGTAGLVTGVGGSGIAGPGRVENSGAREVARNDAVGAEEAESPVRPLKATAPKETPPASKPAHVPDWGAANHNASVSPALLEAPTNPTDGTRDSDTL